MRSCSLLASHSPQPSKLMLENLAKAEKLDPMERLMYLAAIGLLLVVAVKPPKETK